MDVVKDVIANNDYAGESKAREEEVKRLLGGYDRMVTELKQDLEDLGFEITGDGKHYKMTYYNDSRYMITLPKTPSDFRTGKNCAATICRKVF